MSPLSLLKLLSHFFQAPAFKVIVTTPLRIFYSLIKPKKKAEYNICVKVKHLKDIGKAAGMGFGPMSYNISHSLLFEKGK